jgi:hypothetical protein
MRPDLGNCKPVGLFGIRAAEVENYLPPLTVGRILRVGKATEAKLT